jgi:membrane fusion protein, multidrug efflux system
MTGTTPSPISRPEPKRRPIWRTLLGIVIVVLIAIVLAIVLTFCAAHGGGEPGGAPGGGPGGHGGRGGRFGSGPGGRPAVTVGVAKATLGEIPITQSALGAVTPLATVQVNARVSGLLDHVAFKEGQTVRRGQLLAQIDPRPFQVALDQAQGQLNHDQALLADAKLDLQRYSTLKAQDSISGQTYDTQAALVKQYEGAVFTDRATVANAKLNLSFSHVTSPVSGRIGLRQVDPGNQITANQTTPFAVVTQLDPISVVFSVPEQVIAPIVAKGGAGLRVTVFDRAGGTSLAQGTLTTLDNLIDPTTGTVKARARFDNPKSALFPNEFVNVVLLIDVLKNQVVIPTTAVRHGPQGDFVWVLQPNRTVKSRPVKVGPGTPETVSIASGLNVGETVITDGGDRLRDGAKVVLPGQSPGGFGGGRHHHGAWGAGSGDADASSSAPTANAPNGAGAGGAGTPVAGGWQGRRDGGQGGAGQGGDPGAGHAWRHHQRPGGDAESDQGAAPAPQ